MTIEECYARMGADYEDVLRRLGKEERVKRFLGFLPGDASYSSLCGALEAGNAEEAFRAAHSLKGICMNLGLAKLLRSVNSLTEELRGGAITQAAAPLAEQVQKDYRMTMQCIQEFLEQ